MPTCIVQESGTCDQATQTIDCILPVEIIQKTNNLSDNAHTDQSEAKSENTQTSMNLSENTPKKKKTK